MRGQPKGKYKQCEWLFVQLPIFNYFLLIKNSVGVNKNIMTESFADWLGLLWFYCISTIVGYSLPNLFLYIQTVLFQTIQFSISTKFSFIWPLDRTLSGVTTPCQNGPESNGNKGVLCIPQNSNITGVSLSDCLVPYLGHSLGGSYPSVKVRSVYYSAPTYSASITCGGVGLLKIGTSDNDTYLHIWWSSKLECWLLLYCYYFLGYPDTGCLKLWLFYLFGK